MAGYQQDTIQTNLQHLTDGDLDLTHGALDLPHGDLDKLYPFLELTPPLSSLPFEEKFYAESPVPLRRSESTRQSSPHLVQRTPLFELAQPPSPAFPEGGWQAWSTILGGHMVVFCTLGAIQAFGVYQDYYSLVSLNDHPPSDISWIGSVQIFFMFITGLPVGRLFDEGYFHHCVISGSLIYLFSAFMLSLSKPHRLYQNLLSQGIGMGIGMGLMFLPAILVASHYFRARRSLAMGIIISGSSVGAVIYPILLNHLLFGRVGFAWGIRAVGFLDLCLLLGANLLMRTRLPPRKDKPKARAILRDVAFGWFAAGTFLVFWGLFIPIFYLQLFASLHRVSATLVTYSIAIMNGASAFGRILPNLMADKYGLLNMLIPCTIISAALVFAQLTASTTPGVIIFGTLYGFFSGGFLGLVIPASGAFATDLSEIGFRIGIICIFIALALLTGSPLAGVLLSPPHFTWWRPFTFATIVMFAGAFCLLVSRSMLIKRKGTQFV